MKPFKTKQKKTKGSLQDILELLEDPEILSKF